jgi:nitrite reductase/ring-hydroxylating ferredoxin subunit
MARAADVAIAVGLTGAVGAAATGLTDWSETSGRSRRTGLVHGLLNIAATTLYAAAYVLRRNGSRAAGQTCTLAGYSVALGAAYLGGDLVYDERIGVTHAAFDEPEDFTRAAGTGDVAENQMIKARAGEADVLLARQHGRVCALVHACSHLGGPLSEGTLEEGAVVCPWHGSKFGLDDGRVIRGPATHDQPTLDVRERGGSIEVKEHVRESV